MVLLLLVSKLLLEVNLCLIVYIVDGFFIVVMEMILVCEIWFVGKEVMVVDCLKGCVVFNELLVIKEGINRVVVLKFMLFVWLVVNVFVIFKVFLNEDWIFVFFVEDMKVDVDLFGINVFFFVCLFGWIVELKDVLFEVVFVFCILFVDCIVIMVVVFDVNDDVFVFGVIEVEFIEFFVVIVFLDERL